ncbi:MAG TPA: magnesium transporter [Candidatus Kapabacteria bacterium]|nr:magnesium transporter [Candidatus Kapabacteria bacterium]
MLGKLLQPEINELIASRSFLSLKEVLATLAPADIADVIEDVEQEDRAIIFRLLARDLAADVFEYLDFETQEAMLKSLARSEVAQILNEMAADDRTELLEELPGNATNQLLSLLTPSERAIATKLLGYPEYSIGRLMTPEYIAVREQWTVQQVLDYIRKSGKNKETLLVLYVIDEKGKLIDDISIGKFLLAQPDTKVAELVGTKMVSLNAFDEQEKAIEIFREYDREALPVVDSNGILLGVVTIDDMFDVAEEEATEDIQKLGGVEALEEPYLDISFATLIKKRVGWLVILFVSEMFTSTAMGYFEKEIEKAIVLTLFVPLIMSSGGNSGSQASSLVIRALALGEITLKDWFRVFRRELFSGLALGLMLGCVGFLRIFIWSQFSRTYGEHYILLSATIMMAVLGIVLWGTLAGSMLPILLKRFGFDPATSSAPFVATLVDVTGIVIYFGVASLILSGTLL